MLLVGSRVAIKGTWDETPVPDGRVAVLLNPGFAFGTGYDPSTRALLEALESLVFPDSVVVDVGAGSGVLAMAAVRLGAGRAYAMDINGEALEAARRNVDANGLGGQVVVSKGTLPEQVQADLVLINFDNRSLMPSLLRSIAAMLKPEGRLAMVQTRGDRDTTEAEAVLCGLARLELVPLDDGRGSGYLLFRGP